MKIERIDEIEQIDLLINSDRFECVFLTGDEGVGKTTFVADCFKSKPCIFFSAYETTQSENMENLARSIATITKAEFNREGSAMDFDTLLSQIEMLSKQERLVWVIDNATAWEKSDSKLVERLSNKMETTFQDTKLMLVVVSEAMTKLEEKWMIAKKATCPDWCTQLHFEPFNFETARPLLAGYSLDEQTILYGMLGGNAKVLQHCTEGKTVGDRMIDLFLKPNAPFYTAPLEYLKQQMREPASYSAILRAIAMGKEKMSEIAEATHLESSLCTIYLKNLMSLNLVRKESLVTQKKTKKTGYKINSPLFRFWYRFIPENRSLIELGQSEKVLERIALGLNDYLAQTFKEICEQWCITKNHQGMLPVHFRELGPWWQTDPQTKREISFDMVGPVDRQNIFVADCVWSDLAVDRQQVIDFADKCRQFVQANKCAVIFSKIGFTQEAMEAAEELNVQLVAYDRMFNN